jgi:hypothetical protein
MHACRESSQQPAGSLLSSDASIDDRDNITLHVVLQLQTSIYICLQPPSSSVLFLFYFIFLKKKLIPGSFLNCWRQGNKKNGSFTCSCHGMACKYSDWQQCRQRESRHVDSGSRWRSARPPPIYLGPNYCRGDGSWLHAGRAGQGRAGQDRHHHLLVSVCTNCRGVYAKPRPRAAS